MSSRVSLPATLTTGATLSRSGEGVTLNNSSLTATPQSSSMNLSGESPMPAASPTAGISMAGLFGNPTLSVSPPPPLSTPSLSTSGTSLSSANSLSGSALASNNGNLLPANPLQGNTVRSPLVTAIPAQTTAPLPQSTPSLAASSQSGSMTTNPTVFTPPPPQTSAAQLQASVASQTQASAFNNRASANNSLSQATYSQTPLPTTLGQPLSSGTLANQTSPRGQTSSKRSVRSGRRQSSEINVPAPVEVDIVQAETPPKRGWGYVFSPLNIIFLILVFIIVLMTLYASKLNLVTDLEKGERVLNNRKLILWTVIVTIVIAIIAFIVMSAVAKRRRC